MTTFRLELILVFVFCLFSTILSVQHSASYDSSVYLASVAKNLKKDLYFSTEDDLFESIEFGIQTKDPYFKIFRTETDFAEEYHNMSNEVSVKFGIRYSIKTGIISSILKKAPSYEMLREGDRILQVENVTNSLEFPQVFKKLVHNQTAHVVVERNNQKLEFDIKAFVLEPAYVELENNVLTITIYSFNDSTPIILQDKLKEIKKSEVKAINFDLTQCPGGKVKSLVSALSLFVPKNTEILQETKKTSNEHIRYVTTNDPVFDLSSIVEKRLPITFYKSSTTASAAEAFIGSLKYIFPNSMLNGEQTYGKWTTIQLVKFLKGGMLISIGKLYLPNGETFEGIGL